MSELLQVKNLPDLTELIDKKKTQRTINVIRERQQEKKEHKKQQVLESLQKGKERRQFVIENEHKIKTTKHKANRLYEEKINEKRQLLNERAQRVDKLLDNANKLFSEKREDKKIHNLAKLITPRKEEEISTAPLPGFEFDKQYIEENKQKTPAQKKIEEKLTVNHYKKGITKDAKHYSAIRSGILELTEEEQLVESISIKLQDLERKVGEALRYGLMENNYGSGIANIRDAMDLDQSNIADGHTLGWNNTTKKFQFFDFFTISAVAASTTTGIVESFGDLTIGSNISKGYDGRITITVGGSQYYVGVYNT